MPVYTIAYAPIKPYPTLLKGCTWGVAASFTAELIKNGCAY